MAKTKAASSRPTGGGAAGRYIWVKLDAKTGRPVGVWQGGSLKGGKEAKPKKGNPGRKGRGDKTNDGKDIPKDPGDQQVLPTYPVGDPCCYRDSQTGEEWCWC